MRDIRFRAWLVKTKQIVYGVEQDNDLADIITDNKYENGNYELMQFTGLYDKKKTPIYEGDIVSKETFDDTKPNHRAVSYAKVIWIEEFAGFYLVDKEDKILWEVSEDKCNIEVVGNIYDNPDLLGE